MGKRYLRRFVCVDCGEPTEKMWEGGRPLICAPCGTVRFEVATRAAREAIVHHTYACRVRIAQRRQAAALTLEGTVGTAAADLSGVSRLEREAG